MKCEICNIELDDSSAYDYRGAFSCYEHLDEVTAKRDFERNQIILEEDSKTKPLKGLDFGDNPIGKENKRLLKSKLEIASKESNRLRSYEGR